MTFQAHILTLYPEMFPGPLDASLAGRALAEGVWSCTATNIRDFATDKHRTVDDTPAGGGAGMVLRADVVARAVDWAANILPIACDGEGENRDGLPPASQDRRGATIDPAFPQDGGGVSGSGAGLPHHHPAGVRVGLPPAVQAQSGGLGDPQLPPQAKLGEDKLPILALTPRGKPITQSRIRQLAQGPGIILLCGRFEGFDERLFEARPEIEQVSLGDIVLSGGEAAALAILDACIRLLPGVMGAASSGVEESFENGLLEYPHYTRPSIWEGRTIPEVLRSGDHAKMAAWRKQRAEEDTRLRRPDLWERHGGARDESASGARRKTKDK